MTDLKGLMTDLIGRIRIEIYQLAALTGSGGGEKGDSSGTGTGCQSERVSSWTGEGGGALGRGGDTTGAISTSSTTCAGGDGAAGAAVFAVKQTSHIFLVELTKNEMAVFARPL